MKVIEDYIIMLISVEPGEDTVGEMRQTVYEGVLAQYKDTPPRFIIMEDIEWLVTSDWREVEAFQPAHDCKECAAGNAHAVMFLQRHPDKMLALGNLRYVEVW